MKSNKQKGPKPEVAEPEFKEGVDYYYENGLMVLSAHFLRKRGYCCNSGCRHCPYSKAEKTKI